MKAFIDKVKKPVSYRTTSERKGVCERIAEKSGKSISEIIRESIASFVNESRKEDFREISSTAWIDLSQYEELKVISEKQNVSISKLIDGCLEEYISRNIGKINV